MDYEQFISEVQNLLEADRDRAHRAIEASLGSLADRLPRERAQHLVELLPPEVGGALFHFGPPEHLDVDAFLQRVADREGVDLPTARRHVALVLTVLARAIGPDEFDRVAATLPKDFAPLLPRGPVFEVAPYEEIVRKVAERAGLDRDQAEATLETVLFTVAERIAPGEIDDLMTRLPIELHPVLKEALSRHPGHATHVPLEEFLDRVAQREGCDTADAMRHVRAVLCTLREVVHDDEFFDVTVQLPPEYGVLWVGH